MTETDQLPYSKSQFCFEFELLVIVIFLMFGICYLGFTEIVPDDENLA